MMEKIPFLFLNKKQYTFVSLKKLINQKWLQTEF